LGAKALAGKGEFRLLLHKRQAKSKWTGRKAQVNWGALSCIAGKESGFYPRLAPSRAQDEGFLVVNTNGQAAGDGQTAEETQAGSGPEAERVVIKKYANRRLYNTKASSYVTLEHLSEMVREGVDFVVIDAKSGDDITRSVLAQIIFEQESRGQNLLPVPFLRRLIRFYGDQMQGFLPPYLEMSMESFSKAQEQMRDNFSLTFGAATPMGAFEEQAQRNMALFQQAMSAWTPFTAAVMPPAMAGAAPKPNPREEDFNDSQVADLRRQMEAMQKQLDALAGARKP